jgi:hypothetical protein
MKARDNSTSFPLPAAGSAPMRCVQIIDMGTTMTTYKGVDKERHQICMGFELPTRTYAFQDKATGEQITKPHVIKSFFTLALSPKANLRKFLEAWLGRPMSPETAKNGFDMRLLLDKVAYGHIMHEQKDSGDVKAGISTIMPMPAEIVCPPRATSLVYFSLDPDEFNASEIDGLSDWFKERIRQSYEWAQLTGAPVAATAGMAPAGAASGNDGFDDDIPF